MRKSISILVSAALLLAAQGPLTQALAQVVSAPVGTPAPVASIPGAFAMAAMGGASARLGGATALAAPSPALGGLPSPSIPSVRSASLQSRPAEASALPLPVSRPQTAAAAAPAAQPAAARMDQAAAADPKAPAAEPAAKTAKPAAGLAARLPVGLKKVVDAAKKAVGLAPKAAQEGPDYQGMLIQRVVEIADRLDAVETGKPASAESLRAKGDGAWDGSYRGPDQALAAAAVKVLDAAGRSAAPAGLSAPREETQDPGAAGARAPPAPAAEAGAKKARGGIDGAIEWAVGAAYNRLMDSLPGPARVALAAGLTIAADLAGRTLAPALFGFSPAAGFWVAAALVPVVLPIVLLDRLRLAKVGAGAALPLKRHEDGLLGLLTGASAVSVAGLVSSHASLTGLLMSTTVMTTGLFPLAPFMGLMAAMASFPLLYSSGHVLWGLLNRRIADPKLPVPFLFKLLMLNILVMPGRTFGMLLGHLLFPALASYASIATIVALWYGGERLMLMMARNASPEELAREKEYAKTPAMRGLLDPEPNLGPEWRVLDTEPLPDRERAAVRSAQRRSVIWLAVAPAVSAALFALHHMSLSALVTQALPALLPHILPLMVFLSLSSLVVPLFSGTRRAKEGPLVDMVAELAKKAGLPMPRVFEGKNPNGDPNAFATGALHSLSVVAVIGSIRKLLTDRELRGVLGHELSHVKYRHMLTSFVAILSLQLMAFNAQTLLQAAVAMWAPLVWVLLFMAVSRANEDMADAGSALLINDPRALATGLRKLELMGLLVKKVPDGAQNWIYRLFLNHPPVSDRVRALNRTMKESSR